MIDEAIYMDYQATTPVDPRVVEAMLPFFTRDFGNAASKQHAFGWVAEDAIGKAREQVASLIGATAREVFFTSGATESNNTVIKGLAFAKGKRAHMITSVTEHSAVLDPCREVMKHFGVEVTYLQVRKDGTLGLDELQQAFRENTMLVSIMHANNEIGTVQDIAHIGALCHERGALFHTDASQSAGKIPFHCAEMNVDFMSISAHKMYGPKGCGALFIAEHCRNTIHPLIHGGGHEAGMRSGTVNVPGVVGFGAAATLCQQELEHEQQRLGELRNRFMNALMSELEDINVNGTMTHRLPGNANVCFRYIEADMLMREARHIAFSTGSACSSHKPEPSHVLKAIGLSKEDAKASARFGFGRFTTQAEVERAGEMLVAAVKKLRAQSPAWQVAHSTL